LDDLPFAGGKPIMPTGICFDLLNQIDRPPVGRSAPVEIVQAQ
jgi:hypothetical protein